MERHERLVEEINQMEECESKEAKIEELKELIQDTFPVNLACTNCGHEWEKRVNKGTRINWPEGNKPGLLVMAQDESGLEVGHIACPVCECAKTLKRSIGGIGALLQGVMPKHMPRGSAAEHAGAALRAREILEEKAHIESLAAEKLKNV